jgi:hypothetical protein
LPYGRDFITVETIVDASTSAAICKMTSGPTLFSLAFRDRNVVAKNSGSSTSAPSLLALETGVGVS